MIQSWRPEMLIKKCPDLKSMSSYIPSDNDITESSCILQVGDEESREHLIKTHYMTRVAELTTQLQVSDSKAVHFHAEVSDVVWTFPVKCSEAR